MGEKISIDSATMMNKVFEIIEAKNIFNLDYNKLSILIHPKSYVHAIVKFTDGLTKILVHDTSMSIPIFNSIYSKNDNQRLKSKKLNISTLNNLSFTNIDKKKFPLVDILSKLPKNISLFETILVTVNDALVQKFLNNEIKFTDITKLFLKFINDNNFLKYKKISPKSVEEVIKLSNYVSLKINAKGV